MSYFYDWIGDHNIDKIYVMKQSNKIETTF